MNYCASNIRIYLSSSVGLSRTKPNVTLLVAGFLHTHIAKFVLLQAAPIY